jgi:hypothetical protein
MPDILKMSGICAWDKKNGRDRIQAELEQAGHRIFWENPLFFHYDREVFSGSVDVWSGRKFTATGF